MSKIGIFYGSSTGRAETAAMEIRKSLGSGEVLNIAEAKTEDLNRFDVLILGTSTWGTGDLQDDWEEGQRKLAVANLKGKLLAFFGLGDQESFPGSFQDGMGKLYDLVRTREAKIIGSWPTDGYYFESSRALVGGRFVGLALDDDTQPDLSLPRINRWTALLKEQITPS